MIRAQSPTWEEDLGPDETSGPIAGSGALWIKIDREKGRQRDFRFYTNKGNPIKGYPLGILPCFAPTQQELPLTPTYYKFIHCNRMAV